MRRLLLILGWVIISILTACDTTQNNTPNTLPTDEPATQPDQVASPVLTNTPLPTRTPASAIRLQASPTLACDDTPRTRLIIGERGRVLDDDDRPLNIRDAPGTDKDILGRLEVLQVFDVLAGPRCEGGYAWYFINGNSYEGWIAEGDFNAYYVEPYLPG